MNDSPNIARIATLLGDPARAAVLTALLADRALTATELAGIAGVTKQTMSAHLARLLDARLVFVEKQGRHRYFRLADEDVCYLTTIGRKSGRQHEIQIWFGLRDGTLYFLSGGDESLSLLSAEAALLQ